ncbi:MAG: acetyl-CoA acetyltransferase [Chloroflexi bacterium]|nr:acetyl-CoA acetyltransferase [Chloroflexota bacterium]
MGSIRGKVAIVGMGCTVAGERFDASQEDMIVEAGFEAIADAGVETKDIQAAWFGCNSVSANHALLNWSLKLGYKPMTKVNNGGASGADVLRHACLAVASGTFDLVLALGIEKATDAGFTAPGEGGRAFGGEGHVGPESLFTELRVPAQYALYATRYAHQYGLRPEELKEALARIAVKSRRAGARNPRAALRDEITLREALESPPIAWPLGLTDCCAVADGGAAAIVCTPEVARQLRDDFVLVEGLGQASGGREGQLAPSYSFSGLPETALAAERAYLMAGVRDPLRAVGHAQLFDAFTLLEFLACEDLGLAPRGQAAARLQAGFFDPEGELPTNTDGGLLANGYQPGGTGLRQVYESYLQLRGRAGPRQLKNVTRSLVQTQGGAAGSFTSLVQLFTTRD